MSSLRRLAKDHALLQASLPPNYLFGPSDDAVADDLTQLLIHLTGSEGTPYSQGLWQLHLRMPTDYPRSPPKATFRTRIFHPNVEENTGAVCLETLKRDWDPKLTLKDILLTISCLLIHPNPDSALNEKAGVLVREDYAGFERQAKLMTKIHAPIPRSLTEAVNEARRRGEGESISPAGARATVPADCPQVDEVDESADSAKENDDVRATIKTEITRKNVLGKRPLAELPIPKDQSQNNTDANLMVGEPLRKSPKHSHPNQIVPPEQSIAQIDRSHIAVPVPSQIKSAPASRVSSATRPPLKTASSGSSGKLRTQPRIGIRRL